METAIKIICFFCGSAILVLRPISMDYFSKSSLLGSYTYYLAFATIILFLIGMSFDSFLLSNALDLNREEDSYNIKKKNHDNGITNLNSIAGTWLLIAFVFCILNFIRFNDFFNVIILSGSLISGNFSLALYRLRNNKSYHYLFLFRSIILVLSTLYSAKTFDNLNMIIFFELIANSIIFLLSTSSIKFSLKIFGIYNKFSIRYIANSLITNLDKIIIGLISKEILTLYALNYIFINGGIVSNGILSNYIYSKNIKINFKFLSGIFTLLILGVIFISILFFGFNFRLPLYFINNNYQSFFLCLSSIFIGITCIEYAGLKINKPGLVLQNNIIYLIIVISLFLVLNNVEQNQVIFSILMASFAKLVHFSMIFFRFKDTKKS